MGNLVFKKIKKYDTHENLSLIENDFTSESELEFKIDNNVNNIKHLNERVNDFNTDVSVNFNLIQSDIKCIYRELLELKKDKEYKKQSSLF